MTRLKAGQIWRVKDDIFPQVFWRMVLILEAEENKCVNLLVLSLTDLGVESRSPSFGKTYFYNIGSILRDYELID